MSSPDTRVRALIAAGALALVLTAAVTVASAARTPPTRGLLVQCAKIIAGNTGRGATASPGSADPQVAAELSVFRVPRTAGDTLPAAGNLGRALAGAEATSYDPAASVRLNLGLVKGAPTYAVPATLATPSLPARCSRLPALTALRKAFALKAEATGTGPGVCLISTQVVPAERPVSILPGKRRPNRGRSHTAATAGCESLAVMASYFGAIGAGAVDGGPSVVLVPDGVSAITYAFSGGRQLSARVNGNLVTVPALKTSTVQLGTTNRAKLLQLIAAQIPATVTETDATGAVLATYTRPPSLVPEIADELLMLRRLINVVVNSGSDEVFASCSARTHRCVAAVVSTRCESSHHRCTMTRKIDRYRYVGRRPPRGTTGTTAVPTAPIRARVSGYIARPGKVRLALSGTPHRRAVVIVATACHSLHGAAGSGIDRQPVQVAVPSRTPIATVRRHRSCAVNVLVTSSQRGPIHARLVRG
jgi:hypothetical protein